MGSCVLGDGCYLCPARWRQDLCGALRQMEPELARRWRTALLWAMPQFPASLRGHELLDEAGRVVMWLRGGGAHFRVDKGHHWYAFRAFELEEFQAGFPPSYTLRARFDEASGRPRWRWRARPWSCTRAPPGAATSTSGRSPISSWSSGTGLGAWRRLRPWARRRQARRAARRRREDRLLRVYEALPEEVRRRACTKAERLALAREFLKKSPEEQAYDLLRS